MWLLGFLKNLGSCCAAQAEPWGMLEGLKLCWEAGFRRVVVEVDSLGVLRQIEGLDSNESRVRLQVNVKDWRREDWNTRITYVPCEGNQCADTLVEYSLDLSMGFYAWHEMSEKVRLICLADSF